MTSRVSFIGRTACSLAILAAGAAEADVVHLKDGGNIPECRITKKEGGKVLLRTPGGQMGVPEELVATIEKGKTVFDTFDSMRAAAKKKDAAALFKLAGWCKENGLRLEMVELLEKVIQLKPDHVEARHLLGYAKVDGEWRLPPPLLVLLKVSAGPAKSAEKASAKAVAKDADKSAAKTDKVDLAGLRDEVYAQLSILVDCRKDVIVVDNLAGAKKIDGCELLATVVNGGQEGTTFYGGKVLDAKTQTSATFKASAPWIGKRPIAAIANGEVDTSMKSPRNLAFMDAMMRNAKGIHGLFDELTKRRVERIEADAAAAAAAAKKPSA